MGCISWIVFGALAGWIASVIMERNRRLGFIANIVTGILGALVGGALMGLLGRRGVGGFNCPSLIVAVLGAIIVLAVTGWGAQRWRGD